MTRYLNDHMNPKQAWGNQLVSNWVISYLSVDLLASWASYVPQLYQKMHNCKEYGTGSTMTRYLNDHINAKHQDSGNQLVSNRVVSLLGSRFASLLSFIWTTALSRGAFLQGMWERLYKYRWEWQISHWTGWTHSRECLFFAAFLMWCAWMTWMTWPT